MSSADNFNPGPAEPGYSFLLQTVWIQISHPEEANWSRSVLFDIQYLNGWQIEVGVTS